MESGELNCSICLSLYTDAVSLRCGHNFCRSCIARVQETQDGSGGYSCPDCRAEYPECPPLEKKRKMDNIELDMEETRIFCTYCTKSPVPAVKSCLQCENSLCEDHLTAHNNSADHILIEPTSSFGNKKCPIHKKALEYYCPQDAACLCVSCCLVGKHRGHQVELLDEASEVKKKKLKKDLEELNSQKAVFQTRVQNLRGHQKNIQEKASNKRENISKIFMDAKKQLELAEKKALSEISRQEEKIVSQISDQIKKLEIKEDALCRKMRHLEEMCRVTDPIRLLQESDITGCGHGDGEDTREDGGMIMSEYTLDEVLISLTLHRSMRDIITNVTSQLGFQVPDILLDEDTANLNIHLSKGLKRAKGSSALFNIVKGFSAVYNRPNTCKRFLDYPQVLSRCGLTSGRHYWEVKWNQTMLRCDIGVSYNSIKRKSAESFIGNNKKSWCLILEHDKYYVKHNSVKKYLDLEQNGSTFGVFLDYEAGRLSFYELCDPIRHLHTFSASFTEPLHAAFYLSYGVSVTIQS